MAGFSENFTTVFFERDLKRSVQMNRSEPNPYLRMMRLITDYITFLRGRKLDTLLQGNPQLASSHLCSLLQPAAPREHVTAEVTLKNPSLSKDWAAFVEYVLEKAVALDEFQQITQGNSSQRALVDTPSAWYGSSGPTRPRQFHRHRS